MLTITSRSSNARQRRAGSLETRGRILAAALSMFAEEGFNRTTVRGIANRAGITDAAIYYHFATKEDLFHELIATRLSAYRDEDGKPGPDDIQRAMMALVDETLDLFRGDGELLTLILREALLGDTLALGRYTSLLRAWESHAADRLRRFERSGRLEPGESVHLARQIVYLVIMAFEDMLLLRPGTSDEPWERRARVRRFIARSIKRLSAGITARNKLRAATCTLG